MVEHNSEMFIASDNLAKHPKICYVPNAIINCDDETRKSQKHGDFTFPLPSSFWIGYNWLTEN